MGDVHRNIGRCDVIILWMVNHYNGLNMLADLYAVGLIPEEIFRPGSDDWACLSSHFYPTMLTQPCLSQHILGLDSCPTFNGWWLRVAVIEDRLDDVRVIDLGDDTQRSATQLFQNVVAKVVAKIVAPKRYPHLAVRPFGRGLHAIVRDARA